MYNSTVNCNSETGIRFGVIAVNNLDPDVQHELFYGPDAVDLSYQAAYKEAKRQAHAAYADIVEQAQIAADEVDPHMGEWTREDFVAKWIAEHHTGHDNEEDFVDMELEAFSDMCQIDEPEIEGKYGGGVKYQISWLGGAPLLWVIEGPIGYVNALCSPCVPNAGDLDSGFIPGNANDPVQTLTEGYLCYVVPRDWLYKEPT